MGSLLYIVLYTHIHTHIHVYVRVYIYIQNLRTISLVGCFVGLFIIIILNEKQVPISLLEMNITGSCPSSSGTILRAFTVASLVSCLG